MRGYFIAGNWKMNKTEGEAVALARDVVAALAGCPHQVMIAPPYTALSAVAKIVAGSRIALGAQNVSPQASGAHTGEISTAMLVDLGVQYVIVGHSERRMLYGETDAVVNAKLARVLDAGLHAILCVGETLDQRDAGKAFEVVQEQTKAAFAGIGDPRAVTVAYEPVWAIGTGRTAGAADAQAAHAVIRACVTGLFGAAVADGMRIQYGGSVKAANARELMSMPDIDGALVGGASLTAADFVPIAQFDA